MRDSWSEKVNLFFIERIPLLSTLIFMFISFVPMNFIQLDYFRPLVGLLCVYYWTLKRSDLFSYCSAFIVGFFIDIYSSSPLGLNILLMLGVTALTCRLAHYFQGASFGGGWFIFGLVGLGVMMLKWLLLMIYFGRILPITEAFFNYLSSVMFYPLIVLINIKLQNKFLPQEYVNE